MSEYPPRICPKATFEYAHMLCDFFANRDFSPIIVLFCERFILLRQVSHTGDFDTSFAPISLK